MPVNPVILSFTEEKALEAQGYRVVAGVDEVGRGCLAGPVVAAAVVLPYHPGASWFDEVNDSKLLTPLKREFLCSRIKEVAIAIGIGEISSEIIDAKGIVTATRMAMKQAIEQLSPVPDYVLIDYLTLPEVCLPQKGITDGDFLCFSIACASIVAKVTRDRQMVEMDAKYPGYSLAQNKGYGTQEHISSLLRLGPCPIHRRSFQPVRDAEK